MIIFGLLAIGIGTAAYSTYSLLRSDPQIRDQVYTKPLSTMPGNAKELLGEMLDAAIREKGGSGKVGDNQISALRLELLEMLAQGAVEQRNQEMKVTREQISYLGQFLSWFMKQKGLSYEQIEEKFRKQFPASEQQKFEEIIASASRANPNVMNKLIGKVTNTAAH